ncbi:carboxypeptidase-like regulatory domain-containing protein [Priestia aryabhattai]|uniref:carboxypeptidase-like regulatory domain-containing protein n=1 Tax=Priestia aryabhattai TaxID=412384 RepID=UPI0027E52048|nr:carboxypeptidase-like regulatory domain-containing protein [Priestia aryabhattai]WJX02526.1 carboxypeptidase-like regulatory domain-containing protein [Priestia aryabhattai]
MGAVVNILEQGTNTLIESTLTDGNGVYLAEGLPEGNIVVTTTFQNYASSVTSTSLAPNQTKVLNNVFSHFPSTIVGTATDNATASPISGVSVQLVVAQTGITVASTVTSSDGAYTLANLPQGTFNIIFSTNNYAAQTVTVNLAPGEVETVSPSLTPNSATITGTVLDSVTSTPIANALVQVLNSQGVLLASVLTDATGQYLVFGLNEGEYRVVVSADNYDTQPFRIILTPGEQEILNAALTPNPATSQGTVTDT